MKYILLILFLLGFYQSSIAQSPAYYVIGKEEFSNIDVYSLHFQESSNTLYAATDRGLYYYRQNKFRPIKPSEKQIGNSFFSLIESQTGRLFCCNLLGQVFEIKDTKLLLYYQFPKGQSAISCKIFFDKKDNLIVCSDFLIRKISPDKKVTILDTKEKDFYKERDKLLVFNSTQFPSGEIFFQYSNSTDLYVYDEDLSFYKDLGVKHVGGIFFNLEDDFYLNDSSFSEKVSIPSNSIKYQKSNNEVFFANPNDGLFTVDYVNNQLNKNALGFKNIFISTITQKKDGTIFLGTFKDGVIVIPNRNVSKFQTENNFVGIASDPLTNIVQFSDNNRSLYEYKDSLRQIGHFNISLDKLFFLNGNYQSDGNHFNKFIYREPENEFIKNKLDNVKDLYEYKNEFFCFISSSSIYLILSDSVKVTNSDFATLRETNSYVISLANRGKSICFNDYDNSLYFSTAEGLFAKEWNTSTVRTILFKNKYIIANDLYPFNEQLIIGSEKDGVLFYKDGEFNNRIGENDGLNSNTVRKVEIYKNLLFIQTIKGFQVFDLELNCFIGLGDREGVSSNSIHNFSVTHDQVWLLEKSGYSYIKLKDIKESDEIELPKLYLDSIIVNNVDIELDKSDFSFNENRFAFYFDFRSFETQRDAQFHYQLKGASEEWKVMSTAINVVEYPSLSPGDYEFQIKVVYRNQESDIIKYPFTIHQPFWFQLWFIISCFIFVVVFLYSLFHFKQKKNEKEKQIEFDKQKMQSNVFESKLKAIRSQMNPHFIFNSLNSIQALVLKEDKEKSYDSIEQFSDLVRKTLHFSERNFVSIKEEISFLETYLGLESLRMKKDFKFTINNGFNQNVKIPSLLFQPFIENSIHHGLLHKEGEKHLTISFYLENNDACCKIEDNGIGRVEAKKIYKRQNQTHQSFSLNAMEDRLKILSEQYHKQYGYEIIDRYDADQKPVGTTVIVRFPFQGEY